jgi:hypothetical protein
MIMPLPADDPFSCRLASTVIAYDGTNALKHAWSSDIFLLQKMFQQAASNGKMSYCS